MTFTLPPPRLRNLSAAISWAFPCQNSIQPAPFHGSTSPLPTSPNPLGEQALSVPLRAPGNLQLPALTGVGAVDGRCRTDSSDLGQQQRFAAWSRGKFFLELQPLQGQRPSATDAGLWLPWPQKQEDHWWRLRLLRCWDAHQDGVRSRWVPGKATGTVRPCRSIRSNLLRQTAREGVRAKGLAAGPGPAHQGSRPRSKQEIARSARSPAPPHVQAACWRPVPGLNSRSDGTKLRNGAESGVPWCGMEQRLHRPKEARRWPTPARGNARNWFWAALAAR